MGLKDDHNRWIETTAEKWWSDNAWEEKNREFDNRPLNTGSTINSELANQPTLRALSTCVVYTKNRCRVVRWSRVMKHEEKI